VVLVIYPLEAGLSFFSRPKLISYNVYMRTGLFTQSFYQNLRPSRNLLKAHSHSVPVGHTPKSPQKPIIFLTVYPRHSRSATPDNIQPFPADVPLTKISTSSIITKNKRMWRNLADAQVSGTCSRKGVEVRLLSSAVEFCPSMWIYQPQMGPLASGGFKVGGYIRPIKEAGVAITNSIRQAAKNRRYLNGKTQNFTDFFIYEMIYDHRIFVGT
jgi:hypothetical protein